MASNRGKSSSTVVLLGLVSFLNDLSSEMIMPILPMFIASLGGGGVALGVVGGLRDSVVSLLKVYSGFISDRTGRRKALVTAGYSLSSVFKFMLAFATVWWHVLIFTALERVGKGLRTAPRDAMIADAMPHARGRGFGIHRAFDSLGATGGSVVALLLIWHWGLDFRTIIVVAGIVSIASLLPLIWVKDSGVKPRPISFSVGIRQLPSGLRAFILVAAIFTFANISYMFFIMRTQPYFAGSLSVVVPVLLYIVYNMSYTLSSIPFGILSDKIGRRKTITIGYIGFSIVSAGFVFITTTVGFVLLFLLYGVATAIVDASHRAFVSELAGSGLKGTGLGAFHTVMGLMALPSGVVAGILWELSPEYTFMFAASLSALAAVVLMGSGRALSAAR